MTQPYIAQIMMGGFNFAPINYAFCQGQIMAISQNTALFSLIGTTYGGNGSTTFGLPNLQTSTVMGFGQGPGLSNYALGQVSGAANVTLTLNELPAHTHFVSAIGGTDNEVTPTNNGWLGAVAGPGKIFSTVTPPDQVMAPSVLSSSGGSQPHNNEQPYLGTNFCIALFGIFPTRN
jgi:microcystin-dependent protein